MAIRDLGAKNVSHDDWRDIQMLSSETFEQTPQESQLINLQKITKILSSTYQKQAKALPYFKKAVEINPNFYPAWREQGILKSQEMQILADINSDSSLNPKATLAAKEALFAYNKASKLNPSDVGLYMLKAQLLGDLSRHQEQIEAYTQAIKINPITILYVSRSYAYCQIGDKEKAEADMNRAEELGYVNLAKDLPVCEY